MNRLFFISILVLGLACGDDDVPPAGGFDSGAGGTDAATPDSGPTPDAGSDAGPSDDAGNTTDAGSDAGPALDAGAADAATGGMCPPAGPFGTAVGDVAPDAMLEDCEGNPVSLHSMCGSPSWLYRFSEWCPPCQAFVRNDAEMFYQQFAEEGVGAVIVIAQNGDGAIATQTDCMRLREAFGLSFPVLIDPRNEMNNLGISVNAEAMAFDADMRITYSAKYNHSGIPDAIMSAL